MKFFIVIAVMVAVCFSTLEAEDKDVLVIGHTMYQKQKIDYKTVVTFAADKEGKRVWNWSHAQRYCKNLRLNNYSDWQVASKTELLKIMTKDQGYNGLYVKNSFAKYMPEPDPKYFDVWMWTRDSKRENLGAFVNFKKGKTGWADKKYKGYVICTRAVNNVTKKYSPKVKCTGNAKQESTHSQDWVKAWNTCSGYTALKKDGSLWQFGKVGGCGWGGITPFDPVTGKALYKEKKIYYLKPKKIGKGFKGAKFTNGGYRMYAIKRDGTLWGWGEGLNVKPKKLSSSHNWLSFGIKYEGNGCCGYDVGLKKDGTLWRYPETAFSYGKYKTALKLQKIGQFSDWKKIVLGCCSIYGLRKNGTMWRFFQMGNEEPYFKKFSPKKKSDGGDMELYPLLKSNMSKVRSGTIYSSQFLQKTIKANKDGTLCLPPKMVY